MSGVGAGSAIVWLPCQCRPSSQFGSGGWRPVTTVDCTTILTWEHLHNRWLSPTRQSERTPQPCRKPCPVILSLRRLEALGGSREERNLSAIS